MGFLAAHAGKLVAGIAGVALLCFLAFQWGKAECRADHEAAARKIESEHSGTVIVANDAAAERAIEDITEDNENANQVDEITESAAAEPGASDVCFSDGVVDQLLQLQ